MHNYCLLIGDRSFSNFQKILDLKGTLAKDQQKLLDTFLSITSTKSDLTDTSFLTNIDMDPASSASVTSPTNSALFSPTSGPGLLNRSSSADAGAGDRNEPKAFGEFRRLVSFATRM